MNFEVFNQCWMFSLIERDEIRSTKLKVCKKIRNCYWSLCFSVLISLNLMIQDFTMRGQLQEIECIGWKGEGFKFGVSFFERAALSKRVLDESRRVSTDKCQREPDKITGWLLLRCWALIPSNHIKTKTLSIKTRQPP